ncbi:hypothetical protein [uncultured Deinococcus sp.]|uniref:hypothetical protein n=1 Tax=uncultured Deinococcus sp. TaxID=158789 RepID=UPI0025EB5A96|nr:hypothetical protein [uncultured Deinococcus sp.]
MTMPTVMVRQPIVLCAGLTATITLELTDLTEHASVAASLASVMIKVLADALIPYGDALNDQSTPASLELLGLPEVAAWLRDDPGACASAMEAAGAPAVLVATLRETAGSGGS